MKTKAETLVGFAIKANKCRFGVNSIESLKHAELLIVCPTASDNTKKEALKLSKKLSARLYISVKPLDEKGRYICKYYSWNGEETTYKENCKLIAITDKNFAKPITEFSDGSFTEYNTEAING